MIYANTYYTMTINDKNGSLVSFRKENKEFIARDACKRPLFNIRFLDINGEMFEIDAFSARNITTDKDKYEDYSVIRISYEDFSDISIQVFVKVVCFDNDPNTYWNLQLKNDSDYLIEYIDFPNIVVPYDLIADGGNARIFWPYVEGCLIEDARLRDSTWLKYIPMGYPSRAWEGCYPGACSMQFMAYYDNNGGLYFAAHDDKSNLKEIEYYGTEYGIRLQYCLFPGGFGKGVYKMDYNMVIGVFKGDWYDAAEIYRNWYEKSKILKPLKLKVNKQIPAWISDSPVVVIYPVRGTKDTGDMTPNEYFPYSNALPYLKRLSEKINSRIMALLMHWEGTAPWAPPYVWPPFGGEEVFMDFINRMHQNGNLVGVYCSGIGWTNESVLLPEYSRREQYLNENLRTIMCAAPDGSVQDSLICAGNIRWGHDMCIACDYVKTTMMNELFKIVLSGCDYVQMFDQNIGGSAYLCYSKEHGHPPCPGKWQNDNMLQLYEQMCKRLEEEGKYIAIGCEGAASEQFIPYLTFNDLRFNFSYWKSEPGVKCN